MRTLLEMGVKENRILYDSTTKCPSHLKYAEKYGVRLMCSDSAADMQRIRDDKARLLLRIAVHNSSKQAFLNDQFGCSLEEAEQLMNIAKENQLKIVGVSFDVGVISVTDDAFLLTVRNARSVFDLGLRMGFSMTVLNIGGGFPITSQKNEEFLKGYNGRHRDVWTTFWAATSNPRDLIFDKQLFWPVHVNEWLLIDNVGAYSTVLACSFNGSGMPPVVYVAPADDADNVSKGIAAAAVCSGYSQMERAIK
ncbi:hypothetical protein MTO96_009157 [Rhipicephalus appendiculatus]